MSVCLVPQIKMMLDLYKIKDEKFWNDNFAWVRWLTVYILCQLMLILPPVLFFWLFPVVFWLNWNAIYFGIAASITASYLLTHPKILYGIKGLIVDESSVEKNDDNHLQEDKLHDYFSEEQINAIRIKLDSFMMQNTPYLQKGYGLKNLAEDTGLGYRLISVSAIAASRE